MEYIPLLVRFSNIYKLNTIKLRLVLELLLTFTPEDSPKINNMKILYTGCNLFGQIIDSDNITIGNFTEFIFNEEEEFINVLLSYTFNIFQTNKQKLILHGHGFKPGSTHAITELPLTEGTKIVDFSCSDTRILVLNDLGELLVLDLLEKPIRLQTRTGLFINSSLKDDTIQRITNGMTINVASSVNGNIFSIPNLLEYTGDKVRDICAGNEHCLILDKSGNVFSFGSNSRGQLGLGHLANTTRPALIEALAGVCIAQIAVGGWHSCARSAAGDVYCWGWNSEGQLGLGDGNTAACVYVTPTLLEFDTEEVIEAVGCGSRHTVLVNDVGIAYGMGCNKFNQLGFKDIDNIWKVTVLHKIERFHSGTVRIKCGPAATAIIL